MARESKTLFILYLILLFVSMLAGFSIYLRYKADPPVIGNQSETIQAVSGGEDTEEMK